MRAFWLFCIFVAIVVGVADLEAIQRDLHAIAIQRGALDAGAE